MKNAPKATAMQLKLTRVSTEILIREATQRSDFIDAVGKLGGRAVVFDARPAEWHLAIPITAGPTPRQQTI